MAQRAPHTTSGAVCDDISSGRGNFLAGVLAARHGRAMQARRMSLHRAKPKSDGTREERPSPPKMASIRVRRGSWVPWRKRLHMHTRLMSFFSLLALSTRACSPTFLVLHDSSDFLSSLQIRWLRFRCQLQRQSGKFAVISIIAMLPAS